MIFGSQIYFKTIPKNPKKLISRKGEEARKKKEKKLVNISKKFASCTTYISTVA